MTIVPSKDFTKSFSKLDKRMQLRIVVAVEKLPAGDVKRLMGGKRDEVESFRLRVGRYRIIFMISEDRIHLDKLDTRGDVYKR